MAGGCGEMISDNGPDGPPDKMISDDGQDPAVQSQPDKMLLLLESWSGVQPALSIDAYRHDLPHLATWIQGT